MVINPCHVDDLGSTCIMFVGIYFYEFKGDRENHQKSLANINELTSPNCSVVLATFLP